MEINNIVVAIDDSECAHRALDAALTLARMNPKAHIDLVHVAVVPRLDKAQMVNFAEILDVVKEGGKHLLERAMEKTSDVSSRCEAIMLTGTNPATELIGLIKERDYDLVIMGNRGLSGVQEYLGSVSHRVLHASPASVLIVK